MKKLVCCIFLCVNSYALSQLTLNTLFDSQAQIYKLQNQNQRMEQLRGDIALNGVWISNTFGSISGKQTNLVNAFSAPYNILSVGIDTSRIYSDSKLYFGVGFNHTYMQTDSSNLVEYINSYALSTYITYIDESRIFWSVLLKAFTNSNVYSIFGTHDTLRSNNILANIEFGRKMSIGFSFDKDFFYVEPIVDINIGYLEGSETFLAPKSTQLLSGFIGGGKFSLGVGREFNSKKIKGDLKGGLSLIYDHNRGGDIKVEDTLLKRPWDMALGAFIGGDIIFNNKIRIYTKFQTSFFGDNNTDYSFSAGLRFSFNPPLKSKIPQNSLPTYWNTQENQ